MPDEAIGRGAELAAVDRFLGRAASGMAALVLEGDAGIGKTTLWEAAVDRAREAGFTVLSARPSRPERGLALGGLSDLFAGLDVAAIAGLPSPQRHALGVALLRVTAEGALPDQRAVSLAVAGALRQLSTTTPVLVAIDDAQWLDESTAGILGYALRRLGDRPLGLFAAVRDETSDGTDPPAPAILADIPAGVVERIRLGPLPLASLHRLILARLGRSFPRLVLVRIEAASGGNPLYALEIARALGDAAVPVDPHAPLPIAGSLASLMARRIGVLPAATRGALLLAAAAVEPTLDTLEGARPGSMMDLGPAVADRIVEVGAVVRFTHPLIAQAVITEAQPQDLRAAHAVLARSTVSPEARARHLGEAADGPDETVAEALASAASGARLRGATLDAVALYLEAGRATPEEDADRRLERHRLAAECLFVDLSEIVQADAVLADAIADAAPGPARAEALSLRAIIRYYHGRAPEAVATARQALAEAGDDPVRRALILGRVALVEMQLDLPRGFALVDEAAALLERYDGAVDPDLHANVLLLRAIGAFGLGRPTAVDDVRRGLSLITKNGRSWEHEGADGSAFGLARHTDDLDRAIDLTRELIRAKSGPGGDDPFNLVQLSGLLVARGDWTGARRAAEAAVEGYEREGADVNPAWALRGVALVAAHDGRLDEARAWAAEGLRLATERGDLVIALFHRHIRGFVALSLGDWAAADAELREAEALAMRVATRHPGRFKLAGDQVEVALALGDLDRAAEIIATLDEAARIAPTPWVAAVGRRSAGLLAAARGDLDGAAATFRLALVAHDDLAMPFERARTQLALGRLHRRRREKRLATDAFGAALATFEELGAPIWAGQARAELARVGLRPHAPDTLTETEARVAELAAQGLSSRQIAERLFLSPKTVGNVLGRVYEKLAIHSRAELGARMAADNADHQESGPH